MMFSWEIIGAVCFAGCQVQLRRGHSDSPHYASDCTLFRLSCEELQKGQKCPMLATWVLSVGSLFKVMEFRVLSYEYCGRRNVMICAFCQEDSHAFRYHSLS